MRLLDWLDDRAGVRKLVAYFAGEEVPGGARWAYVFGSVLLALFGLQALTGIALAAYYSPSASQAWGSVAFIQDQVWLGWLVRGLHNWGASAMIVVLGLHLAQVFLYGAYRAPREFNWLLGVAMLLVVMLFALTGYLLPWDQKGYWATQVATNIMGTAPLAGRLAQRLVVGGVEYGSLTLTRFYALHVLVLPATLLALSAAHVLLFKRHKVTPHPSRDIADVAEKHELFWPRQAVYDLGAALAVLAVVFAFALASPAPLESPADPSSTYVARPEWYFLPLFQLLKYFEGPLEVVGTVVLPTLAILALFALPWLDRARTRGLRARAPVLAAGGAGALLVLALGVGAAVSDARDPQIVAQQRESERLSAVARRLAREGLPAGGGLQALQDDPQESGRRVFHEHCIQCHLLDEPAGEHKGKGPDLQGLRTEARLLRFLQNPDDPHLFGGTRNKGEMKPPKATVDELAALAAYLATFRGEKREAALVERGKAIYDREDCISCHVLGTEGTEYGPPHTNLHSDAWLLALLKDPRAYYGKKSEMPSFQDKLSEKEMRAVNAFVTSL